MKKMTTEQFIQKAKLKHGDKYNYSLVEYSNSCNKIKIKCIKHDYIFEQNASSHLMGRGCRICKSETLKNKNINSKSYILNKFYIKWKNLYDYSLVEYSGLHEYVKIKCIKHNIIFEQTPANHFKYYGCNCCQKEYACDNTKIFIEKSKLRHKNKYDYSLVNYIDTLTKVKIICPVHGEFKQSPKLHINKSGCPKCKESKGELLIREFLDNKKIKYEYQKTFNDCRGKKNLLSFDFYLIDYNICIEYNGAQHYIPIFGEIYLKNQQHNDKLKVEYCNNKNIQLLIIKYIKDIEKHINNLLN